MPACPKCNATITDSATRCTRCGASLTQRFTNNPSTPAEAKQAGMAQPASTASSVLGVLLVLLPIVVIAVLAFVGLNYLTSANVIEVEKGVRVSLPDGWKKIRTDTISGITSQVFRGEPAEKVVLSVMARLNVPQEARNKARQSEALMSMAGAILGKDQVLPVVVDLSHDDIIHVQTTTDDLAILATPSAQLAADNFKHICLGTIIRNGDFIHYEVAYDEKGDAYEHIMGSISDLAWGR